jgi:hypothetical protein
MELHKVGKIDEESHFFFSNDFLSLNLVVVYWLTFLNKFLCCLNIHEIVRVLLIELETKEKRFLVLFKNKHKKIAMMSI